MTFYDKFVRLCVAFDKAPSKVAQDIGISKSTVTRWKNGGGITDPIALKLADYFDIPISEIKNNPPLNTDTDTDIDISLERVLSLIPRKPNGDFIHGEKKKFAMSIGFKSGEIVSDWIAGRSTSYKDYLYEIAEKYNVSIDWLTGKTDIREKHPSALSQSSLYPSKYQLLNPENKQLIDTLIIKLLKSQAID